MAFKLKANVLPAGTYATPHTPHGKMVRLKDCKYTFVNCVSFKKTAKPGNKRASIKVIAWPEMTPYWEKVIYAQQCEELHLNFVFL